MILHVVALPADVVVAASVVQTRIHGEELYNPRPEGHEGPGNHQGYADNAKQVPIGGH